jgi:hypothetical protein
VVRLDRLPLLFVPEQVAPGGAMGFAVRGSRRVSAPRERPDTA